jgi:hypothetical protein
MSDVIGERLKQSCIQEIRSTDILPIIDLEAAIFAYRGRQIPGAKLAELLGLTSEPLRPGFTPGTAAHTPETA